MTNHAHLVIQVGELPLWSAMARLQVTTAKFHNRQRRVLGSLWQGRYKAKLVRNLAEERWIRDGVRKLPWWKAVPNDHQIVTEETAPPNATLFDGTNLPEIDRDLDVAGVVARFERYRSLASGCLASRRQTSNLTRERQLLTLYLVRRSSINRLALARCLGRNPSSVSRWLNQAVALNVDDSEFREQYSDIEEALHVQE
jgi:hypothetical protein